MQPLPLRDQILHRACHVLDRNLWIDTVLVDEVDPISPPPLQHGVNGPADVLGPTVEATHHSTRIRIDVPTELRRVDHLVANWGERFAENAFYLKGAVGFGGVEQGHTMLMGS